MAQILKEKVRNRIIVAATDQMLRYGEAATMRQIAHAAGITPGNLYRYYKSKEELIEVIIEPMVKGMDQVLRSSTGQALTLNQKELPPIPPNISLEQLIDERFYPLMLNVLVETNKMCRCYPRQAVILMRMKSAGETLISWFRNIVDQALIYLIESSAPEEKRRIELLVDAECDAFCRGIAIILERGSVLTVEASESLMENYVYIHTKGISALLKRGLAAGSISLKEVNPHDWTE